MDFSGKTILLVEDEAIVALTEKIWLQREGYNVRHVETGEDAVRTVDTNPVSIDLILMDIDLGPGIDGTEAASQILSKHDIPLLFLSSHTEKSIVKLTEEITSYGYVVKGSGETVLLASIKMAFKLFHAKMETLKQEANYHEAAENLAITLQSIGDAVIATDINGCVNRMNSVAEHLCGWSLDEAFGYPLSQVLNIVDAKTRQKVDNPVLKVLESGLKVELTGHTLLLSRDGSEYYISNSAAPIRDKKGNSLGVVLVFADVTEYYRSEEQLRESQEHFKALFEKAPLGYQSLDENARFIDVNEAWLDILGYTRDEVIGKWFGDFMTPECRELVKERFPAFKACGKVHTEFQMIRKDGSIANIVFDGRIGHKPNGEFKQTHCILRDETESRKMEQELIKSEERFRTLVENAPVPITIARNGITLYTNTRYAKMFGFDNKEELIGKSLTEQVAPASRDFIQDNINKRTSGRPVENEYEFSALKKNGEVFPLLIRLNTVDLSDGPATIAFFADLTEIHRINKALKESEERQKLVLEAGNLGFWDWHIQTGEVFRNRQWAEMLEYPFEEIQNTVKQWQDFIHPDDREKAWNSILDLLEDRSNIHKIEYRMRTKNGDYRWIHDRAMVTMRGENGKPTRMCGIHLDVTQRKLNEIRIQHYTAELKASNAVKDKFFSIISHDLKGPFMGFLGLTQELANNTSSLEKTDIAEIASVIHNSATETYELLLKLLEWSKLQTGRFEFHPENLHLFSEAENIKRLFASVAARKSVTIHNCVEDRVFVETDRNALQTILRNLVDNAIKFSNETGSVIISAKVSGGTVHISVKDSGVGISSKGLSLIFTTASGFTTRGTKGERGSGLGLALCHDLVRRCGGEIKVESFENKGTEFTFTLPRSL
ncbi:MAG: PAS domain S-box protein [Ignavibacteria bacterium]|jgi:PAS domain S-box-containing protein|nr:PAS domain S-box protein [Ignavibacteria bacterium]MCU7504599.1 PAS domain S-box protein [Ignavibacteria bacterium]MCU7517985.1 PAS domain S-box protein [Ignavibacteria bacterium]